MLQKGDEWLMSRVEAFAWWCEYRYEIGHPQLARLSYGFGWFAIGLHDILVGDIMMVVLAIIVWFFIIDKVIGRDIERRARVQGMNPRRHVWQARMGEAIGLATMIFVFWMMSRKIQWFSNAMFPASYPFMLLSVYFADCNPMPPWYRQKQERRAAEKHLRMRHI